MYYRVGFIEHVNQHWLAILNPSFIFCFISQTHKRTNVGLDNSMRNKNADTESRGFIEKVAGSPLYAELISRRKAIRRTMMGIMMIAFFSVQILWAYFPEITNTRVPAASNFSLAIWC